MDEQRLKEIADVYGIQLREVAPGQGGIMIVDENGNESELTTEEFVKSMFPEWEGKR
ncbi:hypothetical protein MOB18_21185 [Bacillus inaquosorum]|uniref:hypothetical protein n=1 Tax=Bacillus inaquosorum TaxID=483913 RepID=UPI00227DDA09|nr:hypothetical protein [Bacillus inaquosorum]MCY7751577.1 hypothetical protein [Bacillus inaquosorum]